LEILRRWRAQTRVPPVTDVQRLRREVDDLERKLKRIVYDIENGNQTDLSEITYALRRVLRDEVDNIDRLARGLAN
jgi:hypothetical protein